MKELDGRVALVTGASRGIGRGVAIELAEAGADVVVNYQSNKLGADETVEEVKGTGRKATAYQADVRDSGQVKAMVQATEKAFGTLDILVNNAGIHNSSSVMAEGADKTLREVVDTHLFGSFYCIQAGLPLMVKQARSDIIFITSLAGKQFWADEWAYVTAKSAQAALAQCIAKELSWQGVRVNCIAPTIVESDMGLNLVLNWAGVDDPNELYDKVPFGRLVQPRDVGNLCVFLASDRASHISGQVMYLDCGIGPGSVKDFVGKGG